MRVAAVGERISTRSILTSLAADSFFITLLPLTRRSQYHASGTSRTAHAVHAVARGSRVRRVKRSRAPVASAEDAKGMSIGDQDDPWLKVRIDGKRAGSHAERGCGYWPASGGKL